MTAVGWIAGSDAPASILCRDTIQAIFSDCRPGFSMSRLSRSVASPRVVCIADLRTVARGRVPKAVFDYLDGGAEGEVTLRENCRVFDDITFRPRHAVAMEKCGLCVRVLGHELALPFLLAPVGYSRMMHPGGEVAAARAAGNAGTAYILSTISGPQARGCESGIEGPGFLPALSDGRAQGGRGGD